eukprot:TRINITY_DN3982_c0_g1_i6.p1 TRINITY_DN3982_c0_g1~~TRINITY_DN3982_c0_g1_i6.p1  ORF type:complete len:534 (-),score=93.34 TRINITY_DN3982_c0_g1_i6:319-1920(-)
MIIECMPLGSCVAVMSTNGDTSVVMKGITHGACDYLIKPIRIEALRNIWQHVLRRRGRDFLKEETGECDERETEGSPESSSKKRKESGDSGDEVIDDISSLKRARVHWTVQLHQQFVAAVNQLGIDKAVPKKIVEIMKVHGLSRENVASHLQKYRLYLKRLSGAIPEPLPVASFQAADDSVSGGMMKMQQRGKGTVSSPPVKGLNLGGGVNSNLGVRGLDKGTLQSLEQYRAYQQKLAANRAQVFGGLGIYPTKSTNSDSLAECSKGPKNNLHRMSSVDLGLLWKVQRQQEEEKNKQSDVAPLQRQSPKPFNTPKENITRFDSGYKETHISPDKTFQSSSVATGYKGSPSAITKLENVDELQPIQDASWSGDTFKHESTKVSGISKNNLPRMSSIDMGFLWKIQQDQVAGPSVKRETRTSQYNASSQSNVRPFPDVSVGIPTTAIQTATSLPNTQTQSLDDMSWLDDTLKSSSPRLTAVGANIFEGFAHEAAGASFAGPNTNEANRQDFHATDFGLPDISDYLMDDFVPSNNR